MSIKKVDVVIPVKDEAFKLGFCCKSVLKHIPVNNLIIVVSPSKDDTLEIARKYGNIVITDENKGVGHARAIGLEKVVTEYYASIDADITIPKNWYPLRMKTIQKPFVAACQGYDLPVGRNYAKFLSVHVGKKHCSLGNTMLRTSVIKEVGMPTEPWLEDYILRRLLESRGYKWITDFDLIVTHWVNDIDVLKHWRRFARKQRIELKVMFNWILLSFKDFMNLESYSKHHDLNLPIFMLLVRLARCYGALQALGSDRIYRNLPFV